MHVGGNSSSGGRLPMKGNNTWGGGLRVVENSSFSRRMHKEMQEEIYTVVRLLAE